MQTEQSAKKQLVVNKDRVRSIDTTHGFYAGAN